MSGIYRQLTTLLLIIWTNSAIFAGTVVPVEKFWFGLHFGGRIIQRDSMHNTAHPDFLNYLYQAEKGPDYGFISLQFRLAPNPRLEFDVTAVMLSNLAPNQLDFGTRIQLDSINSFISWGINNSLSVYPQYLEEFNRFHQIRDTGYTADLNSNFRQRTIFDICLATGPYISFRNKYLQSALKLNAGICGFIPFNELILQKKTDGNLMREINYTTKYSPALFFNTEAEICFKIFSSDRMEAGMVIKASHLIAKRSVNFTQTTATWTAENTIIENIKPPKQSYSKTEFQGGIYITF